MFTIRVSFPELAAYSRPDSPLAGRYLIEREIGVGGMAYVFAARDLKHDRVVAVKVLRSEFGASLSAERFTREILIAAGMTHPNILPVHDSGSADGLLYYVMPFVDGETLVDRMAREGRLPVADVSRIAREVATALQFAHNHGIVHRDVKPGNVLLPGGVAVVTDFGLARAIQREDGQTRLTQVGVGLGTPTYMSPEQGAGDHDVDARSDQYSLACMVFEMLTGRPPFTGQSYQKLLSQHVTETAPRVRSLRGDVPMEMDIALARALQKEPANRFASVEEFARALGGDVSKLQLVATPKRLMAAAAISLVLIATVFATGRWTRREGARPLDPNLVAIAPFVVLGNSLAVWREGLVDVLARDFDGAGPLRTVSPSMVLRSFQGNADRTTAVALGRSVGAGIVVYGQLLETGSGRDSVRARVTVREVATDSLVAEFDVANASTQMDAVADSIAINSLRQLGKSRSIAAVPRAYFGSRSLPALKFFLQGEQKYRNNEFKAAKVDYEQAIALDSTFALAYRRMRGVLRGINGEFDSLSLSYAARAGAANHGTSLRDSLLILADSLAAVHRLSTAYADGQWISSVRRRISTLQNASHQYPNDPEVWTELGEASVHYGERIGIGAGRSLEAFEHALQIDSTYGPAFHHAVDLTLQLRGGPAAVPLVEQYRRINPRDEAFGFVSGVLHGVSVKQMTAQLDTQSADGILAVLQLLVHFPDESDVPSTLYAHWMTRNHVTPDAPLWRPLTRRYAFRGRARTALESADTASFHESPEAAGLALAFARSGTISPAAASAAFARAARDQNIAVVLLAFPWWYQQRDTASLGATAALARRRLHDPSFEQRGLAQYAEQCANAYLLLAHGDTTAAVHTFLQLPDSAMTRFLAPIRIDVARLLLAHNTAREAADYLDARPPFPGAATIWDVEWHLERARVAQRAGDLQRARMSFTIVAAAWNRADPSFQPLVAEARSALRELGARRTN